ncbi:hypothetical protein SPRG_10743 [Saprolegnia parasitica CBS 223.65]|uniref:Uncharacterized protein n=1 Tax=Saprolegnia parasitica (strain CBS 223.65) TaxID=695850 RepID=A0A067CAH6_SAPPC|nr:hypothetical protein SPRG_10743 [Saprolegnia parasitica CBS 223.65]KDO23551.1 hypothetical protein SPRG_10743 [Saprolegnia parasitica CBS 223.65]|eukprot:XP_012205701.1 hypothetical protein SPRG_10743 [Saprolegnia parasitica CBS 223.65]
MRSEIVLDFASAEAATYAYETLNVDDEISPEKITKQLSTKGHQLIAYVAIRMLRAAASSFYDMALVTSRVLLEFDDLGFDE